MLEELIREFQQKVDYSRLYDTNIYESKLAALYKRIIQGLSVNFNTYHRHVGSFLPVLERNNTRTVVYGVDLFVEQEALLTQSGNFKKTDTSVADTAQDEGTMDRYFEMLRRSLSVNAQIRLSTSSLDLTELLPGDKEKFVSLIIDHTQVAARELNWNGEQVKNTMLNMVSLRQLLVHLQHPELFYHVIGIFLDRLFSSGYLQDARDCAEEINICSFDDGMPEWGFFSSFRVYGNSGSLHAALMYANLSLVCALRKSPPFSEKYVQEIIWQGIKLFRNVRLFSWADQIYNSIPRELGFTPYERRSLDHSYLAGILAQYQPDFPHTLLEYLQKHREALISGGPLDATPWLVTLYNVRRLYPEADFSSTGLGFFLAVFEQIVPPETVAREKAIIEGTLTGLKIHLKEQLIKLNATRNVQDFVYDNDFALAISNRIIPASIENRDALAYLLAMILKSDYSLLFQDKVYPETGLAVLADINIEEQEMLFENEESFFKLLSLPPNYAIGWLAHAEGRLYLVTLMNESYGFHHLSAWSRQEFRSLIDSNDIVDLSFEDTIKEYGNVRTRSLQEYEAQEKQIANRLAFNKLVVPKDAAALLVVKDMEISQYPHNLFLDEAGEFISGKIPVTNILSSEWLLKARSNSGLDKSYSKAIWIPTDSGEFTISMVHGLLEDTLLANNFTIYRGLTPDAPLAADINIVCSHGNENISEVQIMSQKTSQTNDLRKIIGPGKILIFFVCYSGSMKNEFFRNNVTSLVKRFINMGYSAVIAPFWALDARIPKYWLPKFLRALDEGMSIDSAVFLANRKVYEQYPVVPAWACLHLYGNPFIKVHNSERDS